MADIAIACQGVWKSYRIYHQRSHTLKEKVLSRRNMYEEFWALRGVDLDVEEGSTLGIIGLNGSGKSTLLKTMARILTPNRGSVLVNGSVSPLLELGTGFHPELSGRENVFLACSLLGQTRSHVEAKYDEISDFAGIDNFMDIPVKNYSSGMYARLAFAVAISVEPEILIVDEVLSVGDEGFQLRCYQRIAELRSQGRTVVLVSHSLPTIRAMCTQVAWIEDGVVKELGKAADIVGDYLTEVHGEGGDEHDKMRTTGRRYGSGQAEITAVDILDGDGEPAKTFRTGDPLSIRLSYTAQDVGEDLVCGLSVFRAENLAYLFGQNTVQAGVPLTTSGEGVVELTVPQLPLLKGHYFINLALHDQSGHRMYDCHDRRYGFAVTDNPSMPIEGGMVHVKSEWKAWAAPLPV